MSADNAGFRAVNIPRIIRLPYHQVTAVPARRRKKSRRAHVYSPGSPKRKPVVNRKAVFRKSNCKLKGEDLIGGSWKEDSLQIFHREWARMIASIPVPSPRTPPHPHPSPSPANLLRPFSSQARALPTDSQPTAKNIKKLNCGMLGLRDRNGFCLHWLHLHKSHTRSLEKIVR